jgi:hypothetical protein
MVTPRVDFLEPSGLLEMNNCPTSHMLTSQLPSSQSVTSGLDRAVNKSCPEAVFHFKKLIAAEPSAGDSVIKRLVDICDDVVDVLDPDR